MDFNAIEKATEMVNRVKSLNEELAEINEIASFIATADNETMLSIDVQDPTNAEKINTGSHIERHKVPSMGFRVPNNVTPLDIYQLLSGESAKQNKLKFQYSKVLPDAIILQVLSVLEQNKRRERDFLLKKIEKI